MLHSRLHHGSLTKSAQWHSIPTPTVQKKLTGRTRFLPRALAEDPIVPMTYLALSLSATSFIGLFFVAPKFSKSFKGGEAWPFMYEFMQQDGSVKPLTPEDASARTRRGAVLVDVRLADKYKEAHAESSISVPLYQPIEKWDFPSILRRLGFAFFGIYGTEINPNFVEEMQIEVPKGKEIILLCGKGGNMEQQPGMKNGFESRSLKAAYYCLKSGYKKVSFVKGGIDQWAREGLNIVEDE